MTATPGLAFARLLSPLVRCVSSPISVVPAEAPIPPALAHARDVRVREFLAGRWCALKALGELGLSVDQVLTDADRAPIWPDGVVGSVTHTREVAVAAVARSTQVQALGIDLEPMLSSQTLREVASLVLRADDAALVGSDAALVTAVFSAKEALFKALFPPTRVFFDFHDAQVLSVSDGFVELRLMRELRAPFVRGFVTTVRFAIEAGHVHALVELAPLAGGSC